MKIKSFPLYCVFLSCFLFLTHGQNSTAELLVANVDYTVPPLGERITPVRFSMEFKEVEEINENKMHITARVVEYTTWVDVRLAYANRTNVSASLRASKINMIDVIN